MTREKKQLLLQDLSARWPYGVMVLEDIDKEFDGGCVSKLITITEIKGEKMFFTKSSLTPVTIEEICPYLRPMSSMSKEEKKEFDEITLIHTPWGVQMDRIPKLIDWLNSHHFDYRGLIEKGLAIAVTEDNNPYED